MQPQITLENLRELAIGMITRRVRGVNDDDYEFS
jgi:hypothetical protein